MEAALHTRGDVREARAAWKTARPPPRRVALRRYNNFPQAQIFTLFSMRQSAWSALQASNATSGSRKCATNGDVNGKFH